MSRRLYHRQLFDTPKGHDLHPEPIVSDMKRLIGYENNLKTTENNLEQGGK
jgi:hypothetical protein